MSSYQHRGWKTFLEGYPWFRGESGYPLAAYSEYMPPLRTGLSPVDGSVYPWIFSDDDPFGWHISEFEEEYQLKPGLESIAKQVFQHIVQLGTGNLPLQLVGHNNRNLLNNLFWPGELMNHTFTPDHERYVSFVPVSLSRTKDDKGRVRWTLFGSSEQGPEKAFWNSFYTSPGHEEPEERFMHLMQWVFGTAYAISIRGPEDLLNAGLRILPSGDHFPFPYWKPGSYPSWTQKYLTGEDSITDDIRYILTFRPFENLPDAVKKGYLEGKIHLLPFPGSMVHFGIPVFVHLQESLYNGIQFPMLRLVRRNEENTGIRIPQSGWLHQPKTPGEKADILEDFILNNYVRTNRWDKFHRYEDALLKSTEIDPVVQTLFSTSLESLDLYNKPMARNAQILSEQFELVLDGPHAGRREIGEAALRLFKGGLFRYRFYFPAMQAGMHEVFWHRPIATCLAAGSNEVKISTDLITGFMTGYPVGNPDLLNPVLLWPRIRQRELYLSLLRNFDVRHDHFHHQTSMNLLAILDTMEATGIKKIPAAFVRQLVRIPRNQGLNEWFASFAGRSIDREKADQISRAVRAMIDDSHSGMEYLANRTFHHTATREYEEAYWNEISFLAHGEFINKDNADVVDDPLTMAQTDHHARDLRKLGDYFIKRYQEAAREVGMQDIAEAGGLEFKWETDFEYDHFGGWKANQEGREFERNILMIIPGNDRSQAMIMADHYDTAYMADIFDTSEGGTGARLSAAGADDNYSASSTLLLSAPLFLKLAKEGKLKHDIWLLHLTGEEFPSDCMGARDFCRNYIQKTLRLTRPDGTIRDLSDVEVKGVLVMDMIAHNKDSDRDIFQISPGKSAASLELAFQAHLANLSWNENIARLNLVPDRAGLKRGKRTADGKTIPDKAAFLKVEGEVRTWEDIHSTLYNTDGIIFSDSGIPVILFMENYDISRKGYHDTHDTMENIDLDFGAAVSSIAIETVARIASI